MTTDRGRRTNIVIVGGGFAGLEAAFTLKSLMGSAAGITLIDRSPYHSFIPSIHEIISGKVEPEQIRIPLRVMLGPAGIDFIQEEVQDLDRGRHQVRTESTVLDYDYLVLGIGAENNFFDIPGAAELAYRFRSSGEAERIRRDLLRVMADESCTYTVMIAGGGTEGVEVAGEVVDAVEQGCGSDALRSGHITIELIEGQDRLLPGFADRVRDFAGDHLRKRGVKLATGSRIIEVRKDSVVLDGGTVRTVSLLIWTGGIQPSKLINTLSLPKDPSGWLKVNEHLQVFDDDRVYGIGDAVSVYHGEEPLRIARLAYHAQDQARIAALNIANHLTGHGLASYVPKTKPQLISMGKSMGLYVEGDEFHSGAWVVSLKKGIEKQHLLAYLSKPVSSSLWAKVPGSELLNRLWLRRTV
jgi:NADH:ubiquinone reductase (H+-translocating)